MSQPASRVIGIIRISETPCFERKRSVRADDSSLAALLASLAGQRSPALSVPRRGRWETGLDVLPRSYGRLSVRANLASLRDELEREYSALAAG